MKTGDELITEERNSQYARDGYTADHDDNHDSCELAKAGAWYALPSNWRDVIENRISTPLWPFHEPPKPCYPNRIRELVKAGAFIAAEIDRLQRLIGETSEDE